MLGTCCMGQNSCRCLELTAWGRIPADAWNWLHGAEFLQMLGTGCMGQNSCRCLELAAWGRIPFVKLMAAQLV